MNGKLIGIISAQAKKSNQNSKMNGEDSYRPNMECTFYSLGDSIFRRKKTPNSNGSNLLSRSNME